MNFPKEFTLKMGQEAINVVTGFKGTINLFAEHLNGTFQVQLQPKSTDDLPLEGQVYDWHMLDFLNDGVSERCAPVQAESDIGLGDTVIDKITNFKGIATTKYYCMNGCVMFVVTAPVQTDKESGLTFTPQEQVVDAARLEIVENVERAVLKNVAQGRSPGPEKPARPRMGC